MVLPYCLPHPEPCNTRPCDTVARGPIMAMFSSPGPIYGLPPLIGQPGHDPRSAHKRGPAFKFGIRLPYITKRCGPGPQRYCLDSRIQNVGYEQGPCYSIAMKVKSGEKFRSPGPAAYLPCMEPAQLRAPTYVLGERTTTLSKHTTPGPAEYMLPPMLGRTIESMRASAPDPSIGQRLKGLSCGATPGPGQYKTVPACVYKTCEPHYSITARNFGPNRNNCFPGPGAHCPEFVTANRPTAPRHSFGIKHSLYAGSFTSPSLNEPCPCPI